MYSLSNQYLILFEDCIIQEGYLNSVIFDFTRANQSNYVPKSYSDFIEKCSKKMLSHVFLDYKMEDFQALNEYVNFTIDNQFGFICDEEIRNCFTKISSSTETPESIDNLIVEFDCFDYSKMNRVKSVVESLLTSALEFRFYTIQKQELVQVAKLFNDSLVESINVYVYKSEELEITEMESILSSNNRLKRIYIYQSLFDFVSLDEKLLFCKGNLDLERQKNKSITKVLNMSFFLEARQANPYFFKKMFIDSCGNIKNAEDLEVSFGNLYDSHVNGQYIRNIVESDVFQKLWKTTKSTIRVCSDCENRFVCFDTRIPLKIENSDFYFFQKECSYNPYIGKTQDEIGFRPLNQCGVVVNESGFSIDHEEIEAINQELWQ